MDIINNKLYIYKYIIMQWVNLNTFDLVKNVKIGKNRKNFDI